MHELQETKEEEGYKVDIEHIAMIGALNRIEI